MNSFQSKNKDADVSFRPPKYQTGVLKTNCIDCLDRTNVAQFAYGWAALGRQLHTIGYIDTPDIELDSALADDLMRIYEKMGDAPALQYGGSAAHNKRVILGGNHSKYTEVHDLRYKRCGCGVWVGCSGDEDFFLNIVVKLDNMRFALIV